MNIYEFFNSKDIAEYCQKIDYKFTAIEMSYMIWYSDHHTLAEKHMAWQEIIDTMPDEQFYPSWDMDGHTLHSFLRTYMRLQNEYIVDFCKTKEGYMYTYESLNKNDDIFHSDGIFYNSYDVCLSAIQKYTIEDDPYDELEQVKIKRHILYSFPVSFEKSKQCEGLIFNKQLKPLDIEHIDCEKDDERKLIDISYGFYQMWIAIPTPFNKGDIVTVKHLNGKYKPFILEKVPWWRRNGNNDNIKENTEYWLNLGVDWSDMDLCAWFQDDSGEIFWNHKYCYLDLEYYRGEFKGTENFLIAVSNCMQGKISVEELLRSHSIILMENYAKEMRKYFYDNEKALNVCGVKYMDIFNKISKEKGQ